MTHNEAEIIRLKFEIEDANKRMPYLRDEWLQRVQRIEITRLLQELRALETAS